MGLHKRRYVGATVLVAMPRSRVVQWSQCRFVPVAALARLECGLRDRRQSVSFAIIVFRLPAFFNVEFNSWIVQLDGKMKNGCSSRVPCCEFCRQA